jgi:hypothetical protein
MSQLNPELTPGDRIILLHMEDPYGKVPMGTKGTVLKVVKLPFGLGTQYQVNWDNGSSLDLIPGEDSWVFNKEKKLPIQESDESDLVSQMMRHKDILKNMDYHTIMDYLETLRLSGLVNMFQAQAFLEVDKSNLHKLIYRVGGEPEDHPELFEKIDNVRNIIVSEVIRLLEEKELELSESNITKTFRQVTSKLMSFYMGLYGHYMKNFKNKS